MVIFDNEKMEINEIYSVEMYATSEKDPKIYNYGTNFYCSELVFFFKGENNTIEPMPNELHSHIKAGDEKCDESIEKVIKMFPHMRDFVIDTICFNWMAHIG
mgnify:CR=1 FL=1